MKVLVTGHLGFVGKHLTKALDKAGIPWIGYDLNQFQDIRNDYQLNLFFELNQITQVVHLAALTGVRRSSQYPQQYVDTNIMGTWNIVKACDAFGVEKLINFSSSAAYGQQDTLPVTEKHPRKPVSIYGVSKLAGEMIVNGAKCQTMNLIPFTIYGEDGRKDSVIHKWLAQIEARKPITFYDPESSRGYVYVGDVVKLVVELLGDDFDLQHSTYNIGGAEVIKLGDLVAEFRKEYPNLKIDKSIRPDSDVKNQYADITQAKIMLGFKPRKQFFNKLKQIIK